MRSIPYIVAAVIFVFGLLIWAFFYWTQRQADGSSGATDGDVGLIVLQISGIGLMAMAAALAGLTYLIQRLWAAL